MRRSVAARNVFDLLQQSVGELAVSFEIAAHDLNVDGGRKTEIEDLAHQVGGQEIKEHAGKFIAEDARAAPKRIRRSAGVSRESDTRMSASAGPIAP